MKVDSFSLGRGTMNITGAVGRINYNSSGVNPSGAFYATGSGINVSSGAEYRVATTHFDASRNWTGMTSSASPYTNYIGNNEAISIMPLYIVINIWKRLT